MKKVENVTSPNLNESTLRTIVKKPKVKLVTGVTNENNRRAVRKASIQAREKITEQCTTRHKRNVRQYESPISEPQSMQGDLEVNLSTLGTDVLDFETCTSEHEINWTCSSDQIANEDNTVKRTSDAYLLYFTELKGNVETPVTLPSEPLFGKITKMHKNSPNGSFSADGYDEEKLKNMDPVEALRIRMNRLDKHYDALKTNQNRMSTQLSENTEAVTGIRSDMSKIEQNTVCTELRLENLSKKITGDLNLITLRLNDSEKELAGQMQTLGGHIREQSEKQTQELRRLEQSNADKSATLAQMIQQLLDKDQESKQNDHHEQSIPHTDQSFSAATGVIIDSTISNSNAKVAAKMLQEGAVAFTDAMLYHPHRHVRNFERIVKVGEVNTEHRAVLFRGTIKAAEAQTWRSELEFTTYDEVRDDFLATFWNVRCQEEAFKHFTVWKCSSSTKLGNIAKELAKWGETLLKIDGQSTSTVIRHLFTKLPKIVKIQIDYQSMFELDEFFTALNAIARKEDSIGTLIDPLDELDNKQSQSNVSLPVLHYVPPHHRNQGQTATTSNTQVSQAMPANQDVANVPNNSYQRRNDRHQPRRNDRRQNNDSHNWRQRNNDYGQQNNHQRNNAWNYGQSRVFESSSSTSATASQNNTSNPQMPFQDARLNPPQGTGQRNNQNQGNGR